MIRMTLCYLLCVHGQVVKLPLKASAVVGEVVYRVNFETIKEGVKVGESRLHRCVYRGNGRIVM